MNKKFQCRQGDVLCRQIDEKELPSNLKIKEKDVVRQTNIVAAGERHNHFHEFREESGVAILEAENGDRYLQVDSEEAVLQHDEHTPIVFPKGVYKITLQREYAPDAIRQVLD